MIILFGIIGLVTGTILEILTHKISIKIKSDSLPRRLYLPLAIITAILFIWQFLMFGFNLLLLKAYILTSILLIVTIVDLRYKIIPDTLVLITLIIGILLLLISDVTLKSAIWGMILGGIIMLALAMVPNSLGGGDIKLMFSLGPFLGAQRILYALFGSFVLASFVSVFLIIFKVVGKKDHIPFGPFIALATLIAFLFL